MANGRAKAGGEIGKNGEFYRGGSFLPTTRLPKQGAAGRVAKTSRALIEPGVVGEVPDGKVAIFPQIKDLSAQDDAGKLRMFNAHHACWKYYDYNQIEALVVRYNNGERFI